MTWKAAQHRKMGLVVMMVTIAFTAKEAAEPLRISSDVALQLKGQATLAHVDCAGYVLRPSIPGLAITFRPLTGYFFFCREGKKLCKKLKIAPETAILKHYK